MKAAILPFNTLRAYYSIKNRKLAYLLEKSFSGINYYYCTVKTAKELHHLIHQKLENRYLLHRYLQPFCRKQLEDRRYSPSNTITLFAQPRSGSTWVAEILQAIPGSIILNEPLWRGLLKTDGSLPTFSEGRVDEVRVLNFYYNQPIPEQANWPEAEIFFERLLKGGICKLGLYNLNGFNELEQAQNFVIKLCYGNLLFHWFLARFNTQPIVLIRHPCAVVASQLQHYAWNNVRQTSVFQIPSFRYNEYFLQYNEVLKHIHTAEGVLAALWAINTKAISDPHQHQQPWYTLVYEKLLLQKEKEIPSLFNWINKPAPPHIYQRSEQLSSTASDLAKRMQKISDPGKQLGRWKTVLSKRQTSNIMHIVKDIGVDYYSAEELEPDYNKLYLQK